MKRVQALLLEPFFKSYRFKFRFPVFSVFDWIAEDNPENATGFIEKLDQWIGSLKTYPFLGRMPRDEQLRNSGYRVLVIESYLLGLNPLFDFRSLALELLIPGEPPAL